MMERGSFELENIRPTGIKPPASRLPAATSNSYGRTLLETSQSELNSKNSRNAMMPPPNNNAMKHKISGLPEPPPKRKTLAERAGEPLNALRSHMPPPTKPAIPRSDSNTAQVGSRPASSHITNGYRNVSNTSTTSSTSTGIRSPSRQNGMRPPIGSRPASVAESRSIHEGEDTGVMGKRKGIPTISFHSPPLGIRLRKTRGQSDLNKQPLADIRTSSGSYVRSVSASSTGASSSDGMAGSTRDLHSDSSISSSTRDSIQHEATTQSTDGQSMRTVSANSLNNAFADLHLTPKKQHRSTSSAKHRPSLSPIKEQPALSPSKIPKFSCTPSLRHAQSVQCFHTPSVSPLKQKSSVNGLRTPVTSARRKAAVDDIPFFLTKEKLTPVSSTVWDMSGRLEDMDKLYANLKSDFECSKDILEEKVESYRAKAQELGQEKAEQKAKYQEVKSKNRNLAADLERARSDLHSTTIDLQQARRDRERDIKDLESKHERELNELYSQQAAESKRLESELDQIAQQGKREVEDARRAWEKKRDDETAELTTQHWEEMEEVKERHEREETKLKAKISELEKQCESRATESASEVQALRDALAGVQSQLDTAKNVQTTLRSQISLAEARNTTLEQEKTALVSKAHFLEGNQEAQSLEFTSMSEKLQDAIDSRSSTLDQLRKEEMLRRKLNATILELRGNIRVFTRIRPLLSGEEEPSKNDFPDAGDLDGGKKLVVHAPAKLSATGKEVHEKHDYEFDRVFGPETANMRVFEDCRELIQSVVDGYNVSILSYGQTGSGKTFGMSGPDGIIPCSIGLLLSEMQRLQEKGWEYQVEASFVEVYNETLNDLLGDAKTWDDADDLNASVRPGGKKREKHEIHHDSLTGKTTVTNLSSVTLWPSPENEGSWPPPAPVEHVNGQESRSSAYTEQAVKKLLDTAAKNRRVAATKSNERSSRSHSVFILKLKGSCAISGENSEGVLNLVDLAGSERLKQSGAEGDRKKETQAINKSLSALGDVIAALGNKKGDESHIPYRNSKLTYLLQSSLGGTTASGKSSRTLMMLHLSPLQAHWQESRSSLMFGSKVHGAHIGTAKRK